MSRGFVGYVSVVRLCVVGVNWRIIGMSLWLISICNFFILCDVREELFGGGARPNALPSRRARGRGVWRASWPRASTHASSRKVYAVDRSKLFLKTA